MMVSMKQAAEEAAEYPTAMSGYSYGLRIRLNDDDLAKLGYTQPPAAGARLMVQAAVLVVNVGAEPDREGEPEFCAELQITDMELTGAPTQSIAQALYGGD